MHDSSLKYLHQAAFVCLPPAMESSPSNKAAIASLQGSDGSKSFLTLPPGDFHFHSVALGVNKEVTSLVLWEHGSYCVPGFGDTKENKIGPPCWQEAHGLAEEVRYAHFSYSILSYAIILICKARLHKVWRRKEIEELFSFE